MSKKCSHIITYFACTILREFFLENNTSFKEIIKISIVFNGNYIREASN